GERVGRRRRRTAHHILPVCAVLGRSVVTLDFAPLEICHYTNDTISVFERTIRSPIPEVVDLVNQLEHVSPAEFVFIQDSLPVKGDSLSLAVDLDCRAHFAKSPFIQA